MGRIVRRFARFFEQEQRGNLHIGIWTAGSEIAQYEASQVLFSSVISATALGGNVMGGEISVRVGVASVGDFYGLRIRAETEDNVVVTGDLWGMRLETSIIGAAGDVSSTWEAMRLEMYSESAVGTVNLYTIHVSNFIPAATVNTYSAIRISENGGATLNSVLYVDAGGGSDVTDLLFLAGNTTAWNANTVPPGAVVGRIAVNVSGVQRYIGLYN